MSNQGSRSAHRRPPRRLGGRLDGGRRRPRAGRAAPRAAAAGPPGVMCSQRSMIAAARGSVARASAFSASVMVITRRVRISSISVESNSAPALSGATSGWSYRMIGDDQHHVGVCPGSRPASTGQQRCWRQRPAASAASAGGSSSETKPRPSASISRWAPISDARMRVVLVRPARSARVLPTPRSRAAVRAVAGSAEHAPRAASGQRGAPAARPAVARRPRRRRPRTAGRTPLAQLGERRTGRARARARPPRPS